MLCLIVTAASVQAQTISGKLVDEQQQPVAYANIVNVPSVKSPSTLRVKPGDADSSYLYRIITDENVGSHYAHTGLFTDAPQQAFIDIIKSWINAGAK